MPSTLLLDQSTWDLTLDSAGNIAVATEPYSQAQDAASAVRLFQGELYLDTTQGVPYLSQILGQMPPLSLLKTFFVNQALGVPGVVSAKCFFSALSDRGLSGQIQITNSDGETSAVGF